MVCSGPHEVVCRNAGMMLAVFAGLPSMAAADLKYQGAFKGEVSEHRDDRGTTMSLARLDLELDGEIGWSSLRWQAGVRGQYDSLDSRGESSELRTLGLEYNFSSPFRLFVGKDYGVWGRADEINPVDVVNAEDQRRFLLEDRKERKLGRLMARVAYEQGDSALTVAYLPDSDTHRLPKANSIWCSRSCRDTSLAVWEERLEAQGLGLVQGEDEQPQGEWAGRYSTRVGPLDLAAVGHYGYGRFPVFAREFTAMDEVTVRRAYRRRPAAGLDGSWGRGGVTFRWEVLWIDGETFPVKPEASSASAAGDGLETRNMTEAIAGIDFYAPANIYTNVQYFRRHVQGDDEALLTPEGDDLATLLLRRNFHAPAMKFEYRATVDAEKGSGFHELTASYIYHFQWTFSGGVYYFHGEEDTVFGQFRDNDGVFARAEYIF